eukprot:TRINITY_DN2253_c0_g1_i2.p1 TRINITY_DN2253_c0_g1~~TRINITY_DN2253_c0_g1_i2.p1  ORF type:complete len:300 (+),score=21.34 TRINITY_DN2253_c0_g1_i2:17-916(+)
MTSLFRKTFAFNASTRINWFPGHMLKATRDIAEKLKAVDLVIDVRDARIPFASANPRLEEIVRHKNRLIVFNKSDLANPKMSQHVKDFYASQNTPTLFTCATRGGSLDQIVPHAIKSTRRAHHSVHMMVIGYPNVGKSSIINGLARRGGGSQAKTGPLPGVTRHIQALKVRENPPVFLLDTPGVMIPTIESADIGLKLALTGAIKDARVGAEILADYLLYSMNRLGSNRYVRPLQLKSVSDDIEHVLDVVKQNYGFQSEEQAAQQMLRMYRAGELGTLTLDDIPNTTVAHDQATEPIKE